SRCAMADRDCQGWGMTAVGPSLHIGFGDDRATARLTVRPELTDELRLLTSRFRVAGQSSTSTAEVALEDLLVNLGALRSWPHPTSVTWERDLGRRVRDSVADATIVQARMSGDSSVESDVKPENIAGMLLPGWRGPLTDFQRRGIARLLSLRHGANFSVPGAGKTRVGLAVFQVLRQSGQL
ncbi:DNA helicase, partial [Klebsiella pneumoniae]